MCFPGTLYKIRFVKNTNWLDCTNTATKEAMITRSLIYKFSS